MSVLAHAEARAHARGGGPRVGTAGWSIRRQHAALFPGAGTHLARYARRLNAVEINSSFYRPHRRATYEKWAASTPADFAFSVKLPKQITHERRLVDAAPLLDPFIEQVGGLGHKLGVLLVQLPPSLAFDARVAGTFFAALRSRYDGSVVCEPRHASWFTPDAEKLLMENRIGRAAADPALVSAAAEPAGWPETRYYRLHGSPRTYYSRYEEERIAAWAERVKAAGDRAWCIFDNTAEAAATENALALAALVRRQADGERLICPSRPSGSG